MSSAANKISNNYLQEEETIDIKKYIYKFSSNWYWFVLSIFVGLSVSFLINRYSSKQYSTSASLLVLEKGEGYGGIESIISEFGAYSKAQRKNVENQIGILQSYTLSFETVKELDFQVSYWAKGRINESEIYTTSPFKVVLDTTKNQTIQQRVNLSFVSETEYNLEITYPTGKNIKKEMFFGETYSDDFLTFRIEKNANFSDNNENISYFFFLNDYYAIARSYNKGLKVESIFEKGTMLKLNKSGNVAQKEIDFLNKLIEIYIRRNIEEKNISALNTIKFIDEQLNNIIDSLQKAERNLERFRLNNKIIDLSKEGTSLFEKLEQQQAQKSILEIRMKYYEYLKNYIKSKNDFKDVITPSVIGIQDNLLNSLVAQLSALYSEKNVTEYSATKDNPTMEVINLKIKNTVNALIENVNNIIEGAKIEIKEADKNISVLDQEIQKLPVTERELINIQRKFDLNDNIYNFLLEKRTEAGITKASNIPDVKILDSAIIQNSEQISPKRSINMMIGFFLGLLLPALLIIIKDFFNDKITDRKDVEKSTTIPILGAISHNTKDTDLVVQNHPKSSISESFRTLRTNLQYLLQGKEKAVISISSTISGEGKSFCAVNLASIIALSNKKVLLIGLDMRKPKIHKIFNCQNNAGMSTYLIGKSSYKEIINKTGIDNLHTIVSGPIPPNPAELIENKKFGELMTRLKDEYDYIIIDTPPVALVADALLIMNYTDANIFVIRQNYSSKNVLKFVNDLRYEKNLDKITILINDIDYNNAYGYKYGGYGKYSYRYKYGYRYNYGYGNGYYEDDNESVSLISFIKNKFPFLKKFFKKKHKKHTVNGQ
ncbi:MAG: polysaccharide biosynthesis tyrosine autokinase [Bacteroidales bacterium]|nr:polysaccharide biosynthesis tyrosine autokinase [Bacteroidales bacterium]